MAHTNYGLLTTEEKTVWARDVWKAARNYQFLNRYIGDGPEAMIQRITELTKDERGARAVITLVADLEGDGVAGDRTLEGNEEANKAYDQVIRIDQLRHANIHEGRMAEQKSVVKFRENSRDVLAYWLADRSDQMAFLTLSGVAYTSKTNGATRVGSDLPYLDYAADVTVPTSNRLRQWDEGTKSLVASSQASLVNGAIGTGDYASWNMLVEAKAYAKDNFIKPIRGAEGMEVYNVFMTPRGLAKLKLDTDFLAAYRNAMARSDNNPLFKGMDVIYVDGLAIREYRHVYNTVGLGSGSKWGASGTVDGQRVLLCGAQAMGYADIGTPEWVEKGFDYDNQQGISVGKIMGMKKPVFHSQVTNQDEDFGVLCIDTAI
jgi:N4-gp56 family major capsid protein